MAISRAADGAALAEARPSFHVESVVAESSQSPNPRVESKVRCALLGS